eukprot:scaffold756_cov158-Amphora_coffeaeformis.AAC.12
MNRTILFLFLLVCDCRCILGYLLADRFAGPCRTSRARPDVLIKVLSRTTNPLRARQYKSLRSMNICNQLVWEEIRIDQGSSSSAVSLPEESADATGKTEADRIQKGESVILLHNVVNDDECKHLMECCVQVASESDRSELEHHPQRNSGDEKNNQRPKLVRLPSRAAARRAASNKITCAEPLPEYIDYRLQQILQRVCEFIDKQLPSLPSELFDTPTLTELMSKSGSSAKESDDALQFSAREPAINVYSSPGGEFLPHKDDEALTVLVPLSSPKTDFEGGGTAFWSPQSSVGCQSPASVVVKPMAGSTLLFGGIVTHAGIAITKGIRVVLVCSFSPKRTDRTTGSSITEDEEEDGLLNDLLQSAAVDWHNKWTSSELRDSCPDLGDASD